MARKKGRIKSITLRLLLLTAVGCKTIVEPAGNDERLIGTSWRTEFSDPTEYFHFNDPEGEDGLYFVLLDSCYQVINVDIHFGRLIIEGIDHPYNFQDSLLEVTYSVYSNENPNEIIGDIKVRFVCIEFDSTSLNYCE